MRRSAGPSAGEGASPIWSTDSSPGSRITIARMRDASPQCGGPSQCGAGLDLPGGATYPSGQRMSVLVLLAGVVLAVALWRLSARLRDLDRQVRELRLLHREIEELRADLDRGLGVTRAHLAAVAAGEPPERDVILRGAPYRDVQPAEALALYEKTPGLFVLDVRTPAEFASGHIPNAHLIPVDELEDRLGELPPKDTPMLVHCAAGGRSKTACQTLGQRGYTSLLNLVGGMHGWPGVRVEEAAPAGAAISYRGGPLTEAQVVGAIRECYDPELPLNIYDLGLIYGI